MRVAYVRVSSDTEDFLFFSFSVASVELIIELEGYVLIISFV